MGVFLVLFSSVYLLALFYVGLFGFLSHCFLKRERGVKLIGVVGRIWEEIREGKL